MGAFPAASTPFGAFPSPAAVSPVTAPRKREAFTGDALPSCRCSSRLAEDSRATEAASRPRCRGQPSDGTEIPSPSRRPPKRPVHLPGARTEVHAPLRPSPTVHEAETSRPDRTPTRGESNRPGAASCATSGRSPVHERLMVPQAGHEGTFHWCVGRSLPPEPAGRNPPSTALPLSSRWPVPLLGLRFTLRIGEEPSTPRLFSTGESVAPIRRCRQVDARCSLGLSFRPPVRPCGHPGGLATSKSGPRTLPSVGCRFAQIGRAHV